LKIWLIFSIFVLSVGYSFRTYCPCDELPIRLVGIQWGYFIFMAIFRKVHVTFWRDEFVESLTPEQKFFYLYLLTNDRTTQCGIYEITIKQMCYDTGYNDDTIKKLIEYFIGTGKIRYSLDTKEIALKNWVKYNDSNSPKVKSCIDNELKKVKNRVLIQYIYSMDTHSQEEEEQEEEKEQEQQQEVNIDFDWFWSEYDKKVGVKEKLKSKWNKLSDEERQNAMNYINLYKQAVPDKQFRKNPETFLNNKSWNDEIIERNNTSSDKLSYAEREWNRLKNL